MIKIELEKRYEGEHYGSTDARIIEPWQLYDLSNDRTEVTDLSLQFPEKVKVMKRKWTEMAKEVGTVVSK